MLDKKVLPTFFALTIILFSSNAFPSFYKCTDINNQITYSDLPCKQEMQKRYECVVNGDRIYQSEPCSGVMRAVVAKKVMPENSQMLNQQEINDTIMGSILEDGIARGSSSQVNQSESD